jgi:hypothetical protein
MVEISNFEKKTAMIDETTGRDRLFGHFCHTALA